MMINHPNVVKIYGFFSDNDNVYVLKEYMEEGCIAERRKKIGEAEIGCEINQVLSAVLAVIPVIGCLWSFEIKNIVQSHVNML
jgi:serine/threonine protein kinase